MRLTSGGYKSIPHLRSRRLVKPMVRRSPAVSSWSFKFLKTFAFIAVPQKSPDAPNARVSGGGYQDLRTGRRPLYPLLWPRACARDLFCLFRLPSCRFAV